MDISETRYITRACSIQSHKHFQVYVDPIEQIRSQSEVHVLPKSYYANVLPIANDGLVIFQKRFWGLVCKLSLKSCRELDECTLLCIFHRRTEKSNM